MARIEIENITIEELEDNYFYCDACQSWFENPTDVNDDGMCEDCAK